MPTFANPVANGQVAPLPDLPALIPERGGSTPSEVEKAFRRVEEIFAKYLLVQVSREEPYRGWLADDWLPGGSGPMAAFETSAAL